MHPATIAIAPHYPGGLITPAQLKHLAEAAERYGGMLRLTGGTILISGIPLSDKAALLADLGTPVRTFAGCSVRPVALCAGKPLCPRGLQDSTTLGLELDQALYGTPAPAKVTIGVSGCPNGCSEIYVKDLGLYGLPGGYTLLLGGNAGRQAAAGQPVAANIPAGRVLSVITAVLDYYRTHGQAKERLGAFVARVGLASLVAAAIPEEFRCTPSKQKEDL